MQNTPQSKMLSISPLCEDHRTLGRIAAGLPWRISVASSCREAERRLRRSSFSVIVCERNLPDGSWADILNFTHDCRTSPPLIVTSELADNTLWAEVLNFGGYDVLAKPFREEEVRHVLTSVEMGSRRMNSPSACRVGPQILCPEPVVLSPI